VRKATQLPLPAFIKIAAAASKHAIFTDLLARFDSFKFGQYLHEKFKN